MKAHDVRAALANVPELNIAASTTAEKASAAVRELGWLNQCLLGVMRYSGLTPWEQHPDGDELLHVIDGEVGLTLLTDAGPVQEIIRAGSVFIVPRGLWHRQLPRPCVSMLFATPAKTREISFGDDPRPAA